MKVLVLPSEAITALGFAAAVAGSCGLFGARSAFTRGTLDPLYAGFVLSHVAIFLVAYIAIEDVNTGWLAINVWHNFQYVLVVWMMNTKKYAGGIDPAARFLSRISQPGRIAATS